MQSDATPIIYSFIIRFVVENPPGTGKKQPAYRGAIRHIQSARELHFHEWSEAVEFMRRFVPIENLNDTPNPLT